MKVFIVEDSAIMLSSLLSTLSDIIGVTVIGHAMDESDAIKRINALRPDVVTLDLQLNSGSGIYVLKNIKKYHPQIKVVVLTNCIDEFYAKHCKRIGANHFFDKSLQYLQFSELMREWSRTDRFNSTHNT